MTDPREIWNTKDERWVHGALAIVFALIAFMFGQFAEHNRALTAARELMAERQPHLRKTAIEEAKGEVMAWFEATWPCVAFDVSFECTLRERRP